MTPQQLFEGNQGICLKLVGSFVRANGWLVDERDDLMSEALMGLWRAAVSFSPERDVSFSTYSYRCVRNALIRYVQTRKRKMLDVVSLDVMIGEEEETSLGEMMSNPAEDGRLVEELSDLTVFLREQLNALPVQQSMVVRELFYRELSVPELARERGCTTQALYLLRRKALKRLRDELLKAGYNAGCIAKIQARLSQ